MLMLLDGSSINELIGTQQYTVLVLSSWVSYTEETATTFQRQYKWTCCQWNGSQHIALIMVTTRNTTRKNTPGPNSPDQSNSPDPSNKRKRSAGPNAGNDAFSVPEITKQQTNEEIIERWFKYPMNRMHRHILISSINNEKAFSDYAKAYLKLQFGIICKLLDDQVIKLESEYMWKIYEMLDDADIYRGFYLLDRITLPPQAIEYLNGFWIPGHESVRNKLGVRFVSGIDKRRTQMVIDEGWKLQPEKTPQQDEIESWIRDSRSEGKDVRYHTSEELRWVSDGFSNMIIAMREGDGRPLTYNVKLLLTSVWKLAFDLFVESSAPNTLSPKDLEDRKQDLLQKAIHQNFHNRLYAGRDSVYLGEKASFIHQWCTTSPTFSEHQKRLLSMARDKEASLQANSESQKRRKLTDSGSQMDTGPESPTTAEPINMDDDPAVATKDPKEICDNMEKIIYQLIPKAYRLDKGPDKLVNDERAKEFKGLKDELYRLAVDDAYRKLEEDSWMDAPRDIGVTRLGLLTDLWNCLGKVLLFQEAAECSIISPDDLDSLERVWEDLDALNRNWEA